MLVNWTTNQKAVVAHPNYNLLVSASAGSGKTSVLIERVIKLITKDVNPVDITQILICTFTKKAANEMREKIINRLSEMLNQDPRNRRLQKQLVLVQYADISTVHSFCQKLVRENAIKLGLSSNFTIKESNDAKMKALKKQIVDEVLINAYRNEDNIKKEKFIDLVDNYGGKYTDSSLEEMIINLYDFARDTVNPRNWLETQINEATIIKAINVEDQDFLKEYVNKHWGAIYTEQIKQEIISHIWNYENAIQIINSDDHFTNYKENFAQELNIISKLLQLCTEVNLSAIYDIINNFQFGKLKAKKSGACENTSNYLKNVRDETKKTIKSLKETIFYDNLHDICQAIIKTSDSITTLCELVLEFDKLYTNKKRELNFLDFEDLEHFIIQLLQNDEYAKNISSQYTHILVDEYQDTSHTQSYIFEKIARNNNLFMVGDIKQSIYKFRNASPEIFLEKYNKFKTLSTNLKLKSSNLNNSKIILADNFRSDSRIIKFINHIFESIMSSYVGDIDYSQDEKLIANCDSTLKSPESKKNIEIHLIQKFENGGDFNNFNFEDQFDFQSAYIYESKLVAKRIFKLVNLESHEIYDKALKQFRKLRYSDITILCRKTKDVLEILEQELGKLGIKISSDATSNSESVKNNELITLLCFLELIDNPLQDIPLLSVLRSPLFDMNESDLANIRAKSDDRYFYNALFKFFEDEKSFEESPKTYNKCKKFLDKLQTYTDLKGEIKIFELIDKILEDSEFEIYLCTRENYRNLENDIQKLKDFAKRFESIEFRGIYQFLRHLEEVNYSNKEFIFLESKDKNANNDCVSIMTIHKSKGLEFPVLFLFGCGLQFNKQDLKQNLLYDFNLGIAMNHIDTSRNIKVRTLSKSAIESKKELEMLSEEMRLLYVALTRACDMLIITATVSNIRNSKKKWACGFYDNKVLPSYVAKQNNFIDWIGAAVFNKISELEQFVDIHEYENISQTLIDDSMNLLYFESKSDDIFENENTSLDFDYKTINNKLSYEYPFQACTQIPSKLSVSEIVKFNFTDKDSLSNVRMPNFQIQGSRMSPQFYGVLIHFVMQHIDTRFTESPQEIKKQINNMIDSQMIDPKFANKISVNKIFKFFESELGKRLKNSNNIQREYKFFVEMSLEEIGIDSKFSDLQNENCDKVAIQGVIDCFFEEDGKIIIVDYKTGKKELHASEYEEQLEIYSKALAKILDKPVSETHIYEF